MKALETFQIVFGKLPKTKYLSSRTVWGGFSKFLSFFPGVMIFFAISGFLITSSWCHSKSVTQYARNRFLRIFPALFVCFIVLQVTLAIFGHINMESLGSYQMWMYWVGQLTLGQFFTPDSLRDFGVGVPNGSLWTIPVEVEFYILLPLIFILLLRTNVKTKLLIIGIVSIITNIVLAYIDIPLEDRTHTNAADLISGAVNGSLSLLYKMIGVTVLPYLYCFVIGSIVYIYWDKIKGLFINRAIYWLAIYFLIIFISGSKAGYIISDFWILVCNILLACVAISSAFSFGKLYKFLYGIDISYDIYIIHMIIVNIMIELGYGYNIFHAFMALLITIALSLIMYHFVEKSALLLKTIDRKNESK